MARWWLSQLWKSLSPYKSKLILVEMVLVSSKSQCCCCGLLWWETTLELFLFLSLDRKVNKPHGGLRSRLIFSMSSSLSSSPSSPSAASSFFISANALFRESSCNVEIHSLSPSSVGRSLFATRHNTFPAGTHPSNSRSVWRLRSLDRFARPDGYGDLQWAIRFMEIFYCISKGQRSVAAYLR